MKRTRLIPQAASPELLIKNVFWVKNKIFMKNSDWMTILPLRKQLFSLYMQYARQKKKASDASVVKTIKLIKSLGYSV
jgi:hypothetical protein